MDYEKKYNEALERAKEMCSMPTDRATMEYIFPELRESEDERTRKYLIDFVGLSDNPRKGEMIAYLEKQKEPENTSASTMAPSCWEVEQEEQKPADEQFPPLEGLDAIKAKYYDDGFKNGFAEGVESVKPAEWSPTKEQMVALIWAANGMLDNDSPSAGDIKASLRSLYNYLQSKSIRPAEWSEKDERILTHIQSHLKYLIEHRFEIKDYNTMEDRMILESEIEWLKNRFKSLRPSWKPSEVHLSALLAVFNDPNNIGSQTCQLALTDLYEQLKKL